jgi:ABC-type polysaccharide/polyol phosphate export permease
MPQSFAQAPFVAPSFLRSLAVQWRVVRALMLREAVTRYGRDNIGALWVIAEPMVFTLGVAFMWSESGLRHVTRVPVVTFAVTGYSSVLLWRSTVSRCNRAIIDNFALLYHRNVLVFDVFISRILLEMAGTTASFMFLVMIFTFAGVMPLPVDPLKVVVGWLMLAWFGMALAILLGSARAHSEVVERVWHPVSYLLFPLSGAGFMLDWLPKSAQDWVSILPMIHSVEYIRDGFWGDKVVTHHNMLYMGFVDLSTMFMGLLVLRSASRRVESASAS